MSFRKKKVLNINLFIFYTEYTDVEKVFEADSTLFKIEAFIPKDKMKLFLNVSPKIEKSIALLYIFVTDDVKTLEKKSNFLKEKLALSSITHTNTFKSANEIIDEFEIDVILIDGKDGKNELLVKSELIIGGDKNFEFDKINFDQLKQDIYCHYIENKKIDEKYIYENIIECLKDKINLDNCNHDVIKDFGKDLIVGKKITERRIIKGKEPVKGHDGKLLLLCKKYTGVPDISFDDVGTADYRSLRLFDNIRCGQKVARIYKPKPGKNGIDVFGNVIEAESGDEVIFEMCENLAFEYSKEDSFKTIVSKANGYLTENNGNLKLNTEFIVDGDLDLRYGNLDFVGSILVKGNVLRGLKIKANEGIIIRGDVEEANLKSANGSIIIEGYAYGGDSSLIIANKDFICKIAHELTVEAKNNIIIQKESVDSSYFCQSSFLIDNGVLIGGKVLAANGIQICNAGNELEKETHIYLANSVEATKSYYDLTNSIDKHEIAINLINAHLGPLAETPSKIEHLIGGIKSKMETLLQKKHRVQESLDALYQKKEAMLENVNFSEYQKVNFIKKIFPGVKIFCKDDEHLIDNELSGPISFSYNEEKENITENDFEKIEIKE